MTLHTPTAITPITEDDIADYLANNPDFFNRYAELLANVQLSNPHAGRAVSLQERQAQMLREKIKGLEQHIIEMIRHGHDNMGMQSRLLSCLAAWLSEQEPQALPAQIVDKLKTHFALPQVQLGLWSKPSHPPISPSLREHVEHMPQAFCGLLDLHDALHQELRAFFQTETAVASFALIPLKRLGSTTPESSQDQPLYQPSQAACLGFLLLGSEDKTRFGQDMGVAFLQELGMLCGATLSRLESS